MFESTCGTVQCTLPGVPSERQGLPSRSTRVLPIVERIRPDPANQPAMELARLVTAWLPTIGTPSTTSPGIPPLWSVFIICTQLPWGSTRLSSQLTESGLGLAAWRPAALPGVAVTSTCLRRSILDLLLRRIDARCG